MTVRLNWKRPLSGDPITNVFKTDASIEKFNDVTEKLKLDSSPSASKVQIIKSL